MVLSFGRRKLRGETGGGGGHGSRCRHFHLHYHLPPRRASTFSLRWWLPRLPLLSCVLIPLALFFAVLAFVVSFVLFTLIYFVASLLNKDIHHESFKKDSFGSASGSDNHSREDRGKEGKPEAKGKTSKHAAELLTGDSATAQAGARKLEIKEVHVDGLSQVSRKITRIAISDSSLNCELHTNNNDRVVEKMSISAQGMHADAYSEEFSRRHEFQDVPADGFTDEHNTRVIRRSTSGDSLPSVYSISSARIHDLPGMNEVIEMSSDFLVGSNQIMVVPSNSSSPHSSHTKEEYGEEFLEDRKELSGCAPYDIIDFIDKHETRDHALDVSFGKDEMVGQLTSSDGSAHGIIPGEHDKENTEQKNVDSVPELLIIDSITDLDHSDEQRVPDVPIIAANTNQSVPASNEVRDFCSNDETSVLPLYFVETIRNSNKRLYASIDADAGVCPLFEKKIKNSIVEASDPASTACDFVADDQTTTLGLGDSVNGNSTGVMASRENSEDEAIKVNDKSTPEGAPSGRPFLRRSPSQWWKLCGVVDVFAGSQD